MKQRLILVSLLVPFVLLLAAAAALAWLLETTAGLQWTYAQLRARVPGTLEIKKLDGTLAGPIRVGDLIYRNDTIDVHLDNARLDWSPAALLLGRLRVDRLEAEGLRVRILEAETSGGAHARRFAPALNFSLGSARVERIRIERPRGQTPFIIDSVDLAGFVGQQLARVDRLRIDAPDVQLNAHGTLGISSDSDQNLEVQWRVHLPGFRPIAGAGQVGGNLSALKFTQQIAEPIVASVNGEVREPFSDPRWRANARVPEFDARRFGLGARAPHGSFTIDAHGGKTRFDAAGTLQLETAGLPRLAGDFALNGSLAGDKIVLDRLTLAVPGTDTQLNAQGEWRPRDASWQGKAKWQHLRWPLTGTATIESPQGTVDARGTYEQYHLQLDFAVDAARFARSQWRAAASGDRNGIAFDDISVGTLGTTLRASATATWSPRLRWQAQVRGRDIDPSRVWPDWPGSLALRARLSGDAVTQHVEIDTLHGRLRGQTFSATGSASRRGTDYPHFAVKIASGEAAADVSGSLERQWNLSWHVSAPDLSAFVPHAAGRLTGAGSVTGSRARPRLVAQASAAALAYDGTQAAEITVDAAVDLSDARRSHIAATATHGTLFDREFERIALNADGYARDHTIAIEARVAQTTLDAQLRGVYAEKTWHGTLTRSTVRLADQRWTLDSQSKIDIGPARATLEQTCWHHDGARTCIAARRADSTTALSATAKEMPLALFTPLLPNPPEWRGTVSGNADMQFDATRLARANMALDFSAGEITPADANLTKFTYDGGRWRLVVDDGGLHANAQITLPGGDGGSAELALPRFHSDTQLRRQPVTGRFTFAMRDITPLRPLLPLEELRGALRLNFTLAGTLNDPRVTGEAALTNLAGRVSASGIRLHDTRLTATANGTDEVQLRGEAYSGSSRLDLSGRIVFPDNQAWNAKLHLSGERFYVADMRETQVYVSPDLSVKLSPGKVDVTGEVKLPQASFVLRSQRAGVVETSPDVVLVNAPAGAPTQQTRWQTTAQIHVLLGDNVMFSGFGLNAKIAGDVTLVDTPGQTTTARGELRVVKGQYEAYGQKLDVERGRLTFVGGPVSNPGIDARAIRKIDQITAGVQVTGTLQSPQLTLFSDPEMSQSDKLSYLLFGRPLEGATAAQGRTLATAARALRLAGGERLAQRIGATFGIEDIGIEAGGTQQAAALVLGKQLSPRLYINYSIGLFTPENVLHLKYKLGQRWSLEAQSGTQAGGDLIYTIEK